MYRSSFLIIVIALSSSLLFSATKLKNDPSYEPIYKAIQHLPAKQRCHPNPYRKYPPGVQLIKACEEARPGKALRLLEKGVNPDYQEVKNGAYPLLALFASTSFRAVFKRFGANKESEPGKFFEIILSHKFYQVPEYANILPHLATLDKNIAKITLALLKKGAKPVLPSTLIEGFFSYAPLFPRIHSAVESLLKAKADPNIAYIGMPRPIFWAWLRQDIKTFDLLVRHGAEIPPSFCLNALIFLAHDGRKTADKRARAMQSST